MPIIKSICRRKMFMYGCHHAPTRECVLHLSVSNETAGIFYAAFLPAEIHNDRQGQSSKIKRASASEK